MLCLIKQPRNTFKAFLLEKQVAVRMEGYRKTDREREGHSQSEQRDEAVFKLCDLGYYLFYPLRTTPTYLISSATCE